MVSSFSPFLRKLIPIVLVVLVSGCINQTAQDTEIPTGTDGVSLTFFQGAPPSTLGEGEIFDVGLNIENRGGYAVPTGDAEVYLRGVNPNNFGLATSSEVLTSDLLEAQVVEGQIIGGQDVVSWPNLCYNVNLETDQVISFIAQSCYKYQSKATFDACFNQNAYRQTTGTEPCTVVGSKPTVNSNAPVQITSVSESPAGEEKFRFIIKLANQGNGQVYTTERGTACIDAPIQDLNLVNITSIRIGPEVIPFNDPRITSSTWLGDTSPYVKLINGEGQIIFTYQPAFPAPVYTDLVEVTLAYGYTQQSSTATRISAIPGVVPSC